MKDTARTCKECNKTLPTGVTRSIKYCCPECRDIAYARYKKEYGKVYGKKWREKNKEKIKAYQKIYRNL